MGRPRKAIREGSAVEEVKGVEGGEQLNLDYTRRALHAKSADTCTVSC